MFVPITDRRNWTDNLNEKHRNPTTIKGHQKGSEIREKIGVVWIVLSAQNETSRGMKFIRERQKKLEKTREKSVPNFTIEKKKNSARLAALHTAKPVIAKRLIKSAEVQDGMTLEARQRGVCSVDSSMLPSKVQQRQSRERRWQDRNLTLTTWLLIGVCAVIPGEYRGRGWRGRSELGNSSWEYFCILYFILGEKISTFSHITFALMLSQSQLINNWSNVWNLKLTTLKVCPTNELSLLARITLKLKVPLLPVASSLGIFPTNRRSSA